MTRTKNMEKKEKSRDAAEKKADTRGVGITQVQSMDDNYGEWVECMGVASG